jgi:proteasome lid subunit RPN8/RPN11
VTRKTVSLQKYVSSDKPSILFQVHPESAVVAVQKAASEFIDFAAAANRDPIGVYQSHPGSDPKSVDFLRAQK